MPKGRVLGWQPYTGPPPVPTGLVAVPHSLPTCVLLSRTRHMRAGVPWTLTPPLASVDGGACHSVWGLPGLGWGVRDSGLVERAARAPTRASVRRSLPTRTHYAHAALCMAGARLGRLGTGTQKRLRSSVPVLGRAYASMFPTREPVSEGRSSDGDDVEIGMVPKPYSRTEVGQAGIL